MIDEATGDLICESCPTYGTEPGEACRAIGFALSCFTLSEVALLYKLPWAYLSL